MDTDVRRGLAVPTQGTAGARAHGVNSRSLSLSFDEAEGAMRAGDTAEMTRDTAGLACMEGAETVSSR